MSVGPDVTRKISLTQGRQFARRLLAYARPYWRWLALSLFLILLMSFAVNLLPVLIKRATDTYLVGDALARTTDARMRGLWHTGVLYLLVTVFGFMCRYAQGLLTAWIGQRIICDMRADVFRKTLRLSLPFFDRNPVGRLMTRVTSDVDALQRFVTEGVVGTVADLFMLLGVLGFMVYLSPPLALALLCVLPPLILSLGAVNRRLRSAHRSIREQTSNVNAFLQETLTGMSTVQLFNRERSVRDQFAERNRDLLDAHYKEVRFFSLYWPVLEFYQGLTTVLIIGIGGLLLLRGSPHVSLGVLVAYLAYVREFFHPLGSLSDKASTFQQAMASAERIFGLLDQHEDIEDPSNPIALDGLNGDIRFDHVWFAYEDENWVVRDLSFTVHPGDAVAVVGATGAGKSTLVSLLARFYDVQKGSIRIGDCDVRSCCKEDLRKRIGIVLQEPFVFAGTILENITLMNPALTREDAERAACMVNAHSFIDVLPDGYDTVLQERGGGLSLGQKQLLVLARVLAQDPDMLFVLDEATASVDAETEQLIQGALRLLMRTRTSIVIAHRLSTIRDVDRILVMKHGELIDEGSHDALMAKQGYYWQLYQLFLQSQRN